MKSGVESTGLNFIDKVALITGGTSGIWRCDRENVAGLGASVVITERREREGRRLVDEINRNGGRLLAGLETSRLTLPVVRKDDSLGGLFGGL